MSESNAAGLLGGLKVLEFSHVMAAPTCGIMLADMGAEVVKVERAPHGDFMRENGPFVDGRSAPWAMVNRNKRSLALDMRNEGGRATLRRLMASADVFIENYRTGAVAHYGIAYEQIKDDCPELIYLSLSGFGQTGPYASRGGFDLVTQGMSGLMSVTGEGAGRPPVKVGSPVTDIGAGILSAMSILAAVVQRQRTGRGQFLDASLYEAGIVMTYWQSAIYLASGEIPHAMGSAHPLNAPYQSFKCADGWLNLGGANQSNWEKVVATIGAPELLEDPRFADNHLRLRNLPALEEILNEHFEKRTVAAWLEDLEAAGVPAGPVYDVAQMAADPQTRARNMIREVPDPDGPTQRVIGHPVKFSEAETEIRYPAPRLGQHSREVLAEYGLGSDEIEALVADGAVLAA